MELYKVLLCVMATIWIYQVAPATGKSMQKNDKRSRFENEAFLGRQAWIENECNGDEVVTTALQGKLYPKRVDPTKPDESYTSGTCKWTIEAGENQVIDVNIQYIKAVCKDRRKDVLRVVGEDGTVYVDDVCKQLTPQTITAVPNRVYVVFTPKKQSKGKPGFLLDFQIRDLNVPSPDACTPPGVTLTDASGTVTSEGFQDDGQGSYNPFSDCRWIIQAEENDNVLLTFDRFHLEEDFWDWVEIYDSAEMDATASFGRFSGVGGIPEIKSTGPALFIHFTSDSTIQANGFQFSYTILEAGDPNDGSEPGCSDTPYEVTGATGEITSPSYGSTYPAESECSYRIVTDPDTTIQLTIEEMNIEMGDGCKFDRVMIHDGPSNLFPSLYGGPICGMIAPDLPPSTTNEVYVVFESDSTREFSGFKISWIQSDGPGINGDPCDVSGESLEVEEGYIQSVGFNEGGYSDNIDCKWRIKAPVEGQIVLNWESISLEYEAYCGYDQLEVYDGATVEDKLLKTYCGTLSSASPIKSSGRDLLIRLKTDSSQTANGFSAYFFTLEAGTPDDGSAPGCGDTAQQLTSGSHHFSSPGYDGFTPYGSNAYCAWQIIVSADKHISIDFHNVDVEDFEGCKADSIKVHNGPSATKALSAIKCGSEDFSVTVRNNVAFVTFESDLSGSGTGFQAVWAEVEPQPLTCGIPDDAYPIKENEFSGRIIGGEETNPHSLPWQIIFKINGRFACGGSVIAPEWVVTAAHCVTGLAESSDVVTIEAGVHDRTETNPATGQRKSVVEIISHPYYGTPTNYDNDIALLRLHSALEFNEYVTPVCIAEESVSNGTECITSGWGVVDTSTGNTAEKLEQVYLPIMNQAKCKEYLGSSMTDNMLCAGEQEGGIDACQGDSGGPFVCQSMGGSGAWLLHGVTSWGYGCALPGKPGVWSRVTNYHTWIQEVTGNAAQVAV